MAINNKSVLNSNKKFVKASLANVARKKCNSLFFFVMPHGHCHNVISKNAECGSQETER